MKIIKNSNKEIYETITQAIINNGGYCTCAIEKTPETKCPCKAFIASNELGECYCGRYVKTEV